MRFDLGDVVLDCTVAHNFAVLGLTGDLLVLGAVRVPHGVVPFAKDEVSELGVWRERYEEWMLEHPPGSPAYTACMNGVVGIGQFLEELGRGIEILTVADEELKLAIEIRQPTEELRKRCGLRARRLGAGESAAIAIAITRGLGFASDDLEARALYECLGGRVVLFTRDIFEAMVASRILKIDAAQRLYETLRARYRFRAPAW